MMSQAPGDDLISTATTSSQIKAPVLRKASQVCVWKRSQTHSRGHFFLKSPERERITLVQYHKHSHTDTEVLMIRPVITDYKSLTFSRLMNRKDHKASLTSEDLEFAFLFLAPAHFLCEHLTVLHRRKKVVRLQKKIINAIRIKNMMRKQHHSRLQILFILNEESFRRK